MTASGVSAPGKRLRLSAAGRFFAAARLCLASFTLLATPATAETDIPSQSLHYMTPPEPIARILEAPDRPIVFVSPTRETIALMHRAGLPSIAELAEPELRLAGRDISPVNNGPSRSSSFSGISFKSLDGGAARDVSLPSGARIMAPTWSPGGRYLAYLLVGARSVDLWIADAATAQARQLAGGVNAAFPGPHEWLPDSSGLIVRLVPENRGPPPESRAAPEGPVVQENAGQSVTTGTLQGLLRDAHDEKLFEYYFASRLALVELASGQPQPFGKPGLIQDQSLSPDGRYLLQTRLKRPFSHAVSASFFPAEIVVTDLAGNVVHTLADLPVREPNSVPPGPRSVRWRADAPATLVWAEIKRDSDADKVSRDHVYSLAAPFQEEPRPLLELEGRYVQMLWGRKDLALAITRPNSDRREFLRLDPSAADGSSALSLGDIGQPVMRTNARGQEILRLIPGGSDLLTTIGGALYRLDLGSGERERLWRSKAGHHEWLLAVLDDRGQRLLVWRETSVDPPNLFVVDGNGSPLRQITSFEDSAPEFAGIQHRTIFYERDDGIPLTGRLFLPAGYDPDRDGPLPLLIWAYPGSYSGAKTVPQAPGDGNRFIRPDGFDDIPLLMLTQGYAVLEADMPVLGVDGSEPNDTHVEQVVANAEAAVDAVVGIGVADRDRVAVAGWSYGAGMVANLLAHSDLFRTGIALSGAYNRTLTPFGFQATEERTFWEAPDTYIRMSPFTYADHVNEPILLFHGSADPNSGTFPMQSERFYAALKSHGAKVRYVLLPFEGHSYQARESIRHTLWEITRWLDIHLKQTSAESDRRP